MKVNKVSEGRPHAADAVRNGGVQLMFNTTEGATSLADSKPLRRAALLQKTPYYTTLSGADRRGRGHQGLSSPAILKSERCRTISRDRGLRYRESGGRCDRRSFCTSNFETGSTYGQDFRSRSPATPLSRRSSPRRQQVERPRIVQAIAEARSHGDLSENAEYHSAKEAQSHNEGRIVELEDMLQRAEVIDVSKLSGSTIKFGATVTLIDEDTENEKVFPDRRRERGGREVRQGVDHLADGARADRQEGRR